MDYYNEGIKLLRTSEKEISFDHDGIQTQMRSHMIRQPKGKDIIVDFGTLYEEAIQSLRESRFEVLKIQSDDSYIKAFESFKDPLYSKSLISHGTKTQCL